LLWGRDMTLRFASLAGLLLLFVTCGARAAAEEGSRYLNLGFETIVGAGGISGWGRYGPRSPAFEFASDAEVYHKGSRSYRLRRIAPGPDATSETMFPIGLAAGHTLRLTGMVKTQDVSGGQARLWVLSRKPGEKAAIEYSGDSSVQGTTPWKAVSVQVAVPQGVTQVRFGVALGGEGTAWFDSLSIEIDGKPYVESVPRVPTKRQLRALQAASSSLEGDLKSVSSLIGESRIVGLGEASHGSSEIFRMKNRIVAHLAQGSSLTIYALEASMPEAELINRYVSGGEGNPALLLRNLAFWTWYTEEFRDLIEWMREYNEQGIGRIEFWGIDCQLPHLARHDLREFLDRHGDVEPRDMLDQVFGAQSSKGMSVADKRAVLKRLIHHMEAHRSLYRAAADEATINWNLQLAQIVRQANDVRDDPSARELCMADNIEWILKNRPGADRLVVSGHSDHLRAAPMEGARATLGSILRSRFGAHYVPVGITFGEGEYLATSPQGLKGYVAPSAAVGSVEWALNALDEPLLMANFCGLAHAREGRWLRNIDYRTVGAQRTDDQFVPVDLPDAFAGMIFIRQSHASRMLQP